MMTRAGLRGYVQFNKYTHSLSIEAIASRRWILFARFVARTLLLVVRLRKNLNAAKPPEQSKGLGGIRTLAVRTKALHGIKTVPQCYHIGSTV